MGVRYRLDRDNELFWIEHDGELVIDDILKFGADLVCGDTPDMDTIVDLLRVTASHVTDEQFTDIAASLKRPARSRAYVAPEFLSDSIARYISIASLHLGAGAAAVFTTREAALEWVFTRRAQCRT